MTTTAMDLLDALHTHLSTFELPALCSVHLTTYSGSPHVNMQLPHREPPQTARALLAWAQSLTDVTAEAWRVPSGDSVHISVTGHPPGGVSLRVYGGVPFTEHGIGAELAPDASTTIPLTTLRHLATPGEVTL